MLVGTAQRKKKNSTKINLMISGFFHAIIVGGLLYLAAREGLLGKQLKTIAVDMVKETKPKPPDKPKEPEKKPEPPKVVEEPKKVETAKAEPPKETVTPPPSTTVTAPVVAPAAVDLPSFDFAGGKAVTTTSDPVQLYKGLIENALQLNWDRPKDGDDHTNVAEIEVAVDKGGKITSSTWKKGSGQKVWDESVRLAVANTPKIGAAPPTNFPSHVTVRFDVQAMTPVGQ